VTWNRTEATHLKVRDRVLIVHLALVQLRNLLGVLGGLREPALVSENLNRKPQARDRAHEIRLFVARRGVEIRRRNFVFGLRAGVEKTKFKKL
jgi:hypothetical protein